VAGEVEVGARGEVYARSEVESQNGIARLQHRRVRSGIGLRAGVWLHIHMLSAKELLRAIPREVLDDVGKFAAAVVALTRISFRVLVGKNAPSSFQHGFADEVF